MKRGIKNWSAWKRNELDRLTAQPKALRQRITHAGPSPGAWCSDDHHVSFGWLV
jgi:hypothetical protein